MKDKIFTVLVAAILLHMQADAQTYSTLQGDVSFTSHAAEEIISAHNNNVAAQLIYNTGSGQFLIPIKSFKFKKALMQEHFNENYLESDTYPKATYKYTIPDISKIDLNHTGKYPVITRGLLTIKKVSKNIEVPGQVTVTNDNTIKLEAVFSVQPGEYDIRIPELVKSKIANRIDINVFATLNKQ